jgi:tetratricopeptide (TPR) repeat protein
MSTTRRVCREFLRCAPTRACTSTYLSAVATPEGPLLGPNSIPPHRAFFEALGNLPEGSAEWRAALAGLVTLRYLDAWAEGGATAAELSTERQAVQKAIAVLPANAPERIYLGGLVDASTSDWSDDLTRVVSLLLGYGRALQRRGGWALAADVFMRAHRACAHLTRQPIQRELASAAALRAGRCYCEIGDIAAAERMYEIAFVLGRDSGDDYAVLRAQTAMARLADRPEAAEGSAACDTFGTLTSDRPVELARSIEGTTSSEGRRLGEARPTDNPDVRPGTSP